MLWGASSRSLSQICILKFILEGTLGFSLFPSPHLKKTVVKYNNNKIYHYDHFEGALNTFTLFCNHHQNFFHLAKLKLYPLNLGSKMLLE